MKRTDALYQSFVEILREELVPAMGCTEPIAIAYAAAQARAVLGKRPERVRIEVSGNIIKNVKSGGCRGHHRGPGGEGAGGPQRGHRRADRGHAGVPAGGGL